ncbi:MAG: hypothetical protein FWG75_08295 [Cystobacterineae bacterium]|nr:hypothetical protein [Cystobacterineae bacterium]
MRISKMLWGGLTLVLGVSLGIYGGCFKEAEQGKAFISQSPSAEEPLATEVEGEFEGEAEPEVEQVGFHETGTKGNEPPPVEVLPPVDVESLPPEKEPPIEKEVSSPEEEPPTAEELVPEGGIVSKNLAELPPHVQDAYEHYETYGWQGTVPGQTPGTQAGGVWQNRDKTLPTTDEEGYSIAYREFDVNSKLPPPATRDAERFVRGSEGSTYYTDDHYSTFIKIK